MRFSLCLALILIFSICPSADAQIGYGFTPRGNAPLNEMPDLNLVNKLGTKLPLDTEFIDEEEKPITLRDCIDGKPTILVFAYFRCPQLCNAVLNDLVLSLRELPYSVGKEFNIVTVSFDPKDHPRTAWKMRDNYTTHYGREGAQKHWRFLTGTESAIKELTDAAGFKFTYDKQQKEYYHPAVLYILQPDGTITRYLQAMGIPPAQLKYALIDANEELGTFEATMARICMMTFDPTTGKYSMDIMKILRLFGVITILVIGLFVIRSLGREHRRRKTSSSSGGTEIVPST